MANFIDISDYDASIHREILDALVRDDESLVEICEDRAIAEMKSYLSHRYDIKAVFEARDKERNELVLMMAIDIAVYHIFSIHNPAKIAQIRKDRYERAKEWLVAIANEQVSISDAPLLPAGDRVGRSQFMISSNPKRHNRM